MNSFTTTFNEHPISNFGCQKLVSSAGQKLRQFSLVLMMIGGFLFFGATEAEATVNLTIHNTGCQDMKVYKKDWGWETYQTTISAGGSWSCWTWYNQEFVMRKTSGNYLENYFCGFSNTQNHDCDPGGCNTGGTCNTQLAYWNLNACTAGNSYSEFTAATTTPTGFASVSASIFSNIGDHSCSYGQSGEAMCHGITDGCSFSNNDNNAYKFSVTLKPTNGNAVTLGKLSFYEAAPSSYNWVGGGSGDNDPPSKYGVRVTKNGTEIFKQVDIATTASWSLETIDFSTDPDFKVTTQTTFNVEILGYCRQGTSGYAVWDVDEIKVYGCYENVCASLGGDSDGDGVCNNNDCQPNNPAFPATPGSPCNDGNANTTNDVVTANGCGCAGTPVDPCASLGGDSDGDGVCNNNDCQPNNPAFPATPGSPCNDGNANTTNDVVTANGCGCAGTPSTPVCDNITNGGTIGFGTNCLSTTSITCNTAAPSITNCVTPYGGSGALETVWLKSNTSCSAPTTSAAQIMAGLDPHWTIIAGQTGLSLSPGTVSANTCYLRCTRRAGCDVFLESNIISLTTDCGGGGTPNCTTGITITTGNGTISVTGLDGAPISSLQILTSTWQQQYSCFANCGASQTVNVPAGSYYVYAKYYTAGYALICEKQATVTVTGGTSPCANAGGDSDGDGVCNNNDCQPNNPAFPATAGSACNDGNANTTNDVVTADGCGCAGTPVSSGPDCNANITITTGNGTITVTGLSVAPISSLQILTSTWQQQYSCFANCGASQTVNVPAGTYFVYAKYYNASYSLLCEKQATVTVTGGSPCANLGGDTDGDGVCNNNDCQPSNPAYPATPGAACNDGNSNTTNDVVTANGCGCAGTPVNNNCVVGTQRPVANTYDNCGSWCGGNYVLTFGANNCYTAGTDLVFKEFANGTATLTGTVKKGTSTLNVNLTFTGKTNSAPANSPHYDLCTTSGGSSWYYYTNFTGTIGSYSISKYGPAFQVGNGANLQDNTYGASGWFNYGGNTNGDLNFKLLAASNITGPDGDNDGVCDANDCQPNNAAYPATPGSACNDGNSATTNDVVQADGCTCAGTTSNGGSYCKIGKKVWHDKNNDGIFNGTDSGISGCWVNLRDHLGNSLGWKSTDSNGYFEFDNLPAGNYKLSFSTPGGYIPTSKHAGSDIHMDSDIDYWTGLTDLISVVAGQFIDHCDAGYKTGQYLIGQGQDFTFEVNKQLEFANIFWRHNGGSLVNTYLLERSADGINFEEISAFDSRGGSADEFYEDYDVEPLAGDNYYRLAIHRVDGNIAYSEVKKVVFEDLVDYQLFPNPANSFVSVNLESVIGKQAEITVFNNLGLRVKSFQLDEIYSKYYQMDLRDIKEGHYVVWINVAGRRPVAKTLMIGRL